MSNVIPFKIQLISIIISLCFLGYVGRLIIKGKLREEYSIVWLVGTFFLILFSFWRNGLAVMAELLGVYGPPNLVFMVAIFGIFVYLLHLSIVVSKLQSNNKELSQQIALLKNKIKNYDAEDSSNVEK